jgi:CrcB protein
MSGVRASPDDGAAAGAAAAGTGADAGHATSPLRRWRDAVVLYALVALGTVIGGVLRALVSVWAFNLPGAGLPWATLFANVAGSFLIGFYATLTEPGGRLFAGTRQRQFVMSGLCGGFTTFSIFSLETLRLAQAAQWHGAGLNVAVSVVAWLAAVWAGHVLAARVNRLRGA